RGGGARARRWRGRVQKVERRGRSVCRSRRKAGVEGVRKIGFGLGDMEESTAYGSPALRVHGRLLAAVPTNKSAEPDSLAVAIDFDQRSGLLAEAPETYYVTDHYAGHPIVLVRLSRIGMEELRDLLGS